MTFGGNQFQVSSGHYFEDYYYAACTVGAQCLDRYNGHSHGTLGYHYHVTVTKNPDGTLTPSFPYTIGPTFYGK